MCLSALLYTYGDGTSCLIHLDSVDVVICSSWDAAMKVRTVMHELRALIFSHSVVTNRAKGFLQTHTTPLLHSSAF